MRLLAWFSLVCLIALGAVSAVAQPPKEAHRKASLVTQTHGPPPEYPLSDVTVLLSRRSTETGELGVTYSGSGKTVYVRVKKGARFGEKAIEVPGGELFAVLEEAYRLGFFSTGDSFTERVYIKQESPETVTTHFAVLHPNPPVATLTIRIGEYEKTVRAIDSREAAVSFGTPPGFFDLADFIEKRPGVAGLKEELSQ